MQSTLRKCSIFLLLVYNSVWLLFSIVIDGGLAYTVFNMIFSQKSFTLEGVVSNFGCRRKLVAS